MDRDEHGMRLLAQGIAIEQALGELPGRGRITGRQSLLGDRRQGVLETVGQALALAGEAVVPEPFEQVAVVEL